MPTPDERKLARAGWLIVVGCVVGTLLMLFGGFVTFALAAAGAAGCTTDCNDKPLGLYVAVFVLGVAIVVGSVIGGSVTRSRLRKRISR